MRLVTYDRKMTDVVNVRFSAVRFCLRFYELYLIMFIDLADCLDETHEIVVIENWFTSESVIDLIIVCYVEFIIGRLMCREISHCKHVVNVSISKAVSNRSVDYLFLWFRLAILRVWTSSFSIEIYVNALTEICWSLYLHQYTVWGHHLRS